MAFNPCWKSHSNHLVAWYCHCFFWQFILVTSCGPIFQHSLSCCLTYCHPGHHFDGSISFGAPLCSLIWPCWLLLYIHKSTQVARSADPHFHIIHRFSVAPVCQQSPSGCTSTIIHPLRPWIPLAPHGGRTYLCYWCLPCFLEAYLLFALIWWPKLFSCFDDLFHLGGPLLVSPLGETESFEGFSFY